MNYDEFYHHGILGMKWGERNGPPYPLNESDKSAREKRLDKNDRNSYNNKEKKSDRFHLSDKQKRIIKIGAAAAATALAAYGTYRLYKSGNLNKLIEIGKNHTTSLMDKKFGDISFGDQKIRLLLGEGTKNKEVIGGIKRLAKPETLAETLKNTNPLRGTVGGINNCVACGVAGFMRQAGYDVTARSTGGQMQNMGGVIEKCFKGAKVIEGSAIKFGKSKRDAAELLIKRFGQNAEGVCGVQWKNGGGHTFNWTIKDGIVSFFDAQSGRVDNYIENSHFKRINPNGYMQLARLDNLEIDWDEIKKYIK